MSKEQILAKIDSMVAKVPEKKRQAYRESLERVFNVTEASQD